MDTQVVIVGAGPAGPWRTDDACRRRMTHAEPHHGVAWE